MNEEVSSAIKAASDILGNQAALAALCGLQKAAVTHWKRSGEVPAEHCKAIERATGGLVTCKQLCPNDWDRYWPELVGVKGAPVAPEEAKAA